jgi:hypothetical protein
MNGGRGLQDLLSPGPSGFYGPPARVPPEQVGIRCVGARWGFLGPVFFLPPGRVNPGAPQLSFVP